MQIHIDGHPIEAHPGQTLAQLSNTLGLSGTKLSEKPLAAQISGEVFSLLFDPTAGNEQLPVTKRRALDSSGGAVHLLRYGDTAGRDAYIRSCHFVVFLALKQLWPEAQASIRCTMGPSAYIFVENTPEFSLDRLRQQMQSLIAEDFPFLRQRVPAEEAARHFHRQGEPDKARLLSWRTVPHFNIYAYGDYWNYFYGEMLPSSGYLTVWELLAADNGFVLIYPDSSHPDQPGCFQQMPHFFEVFNDGEECGRLLECNTVSDLNDIILGGGFRDLIRTNEALHDRGFSYTADRISEQGAKIVMLAGPSSSGKTTSANRLAIQLKVHGKKPILMSLDDYYLDRDKMVPDADGKLDFEHINAIDTETFRRDIAALLAGEAVDLPRFNFVSGKREYRCKPVRLSKNSVIIVEGLHALNPAMLPEDMNKALIFRLYVSPLLPLNLDNHTRIATTSLRLLRRIVRDHRTRGSSVQRTLSMWESVQRGERRWIYPYQENADIIFNSSTLYELAILKKHVAPLLETVGPEDDCYVDVRAIVKVLNYVQTADDEDEIPPTSLVREFIGGNTFYREG